MTPDITRSTFDPARHYTNVRLQQGRLLLDADWNEQGDIQAHFRRQHLRDVVGRSGAPKDTDAFLVALLDDGTVRDLALNPGRFYVDGLLCELEPEKLPVVAFDGPQDVRLETLRADRRLLGQNHWVRLSDGSTERTVHIASTSGTTVTVSTAEDLQALYGSAAVTLHRLATYATQPHYPLPDDGSLDLDTLLADSTKRFVAYLDVWDRPVSGVEDVSLLDEALGGADTTTRLQRVWQLRLVETTATTCGDLGPDWRPASVERGRMRARAEATATSSDPCIIPDEGGYRLLENQLYRVEVMTGGTADDSATFVWSRDNAARVARVREIDGTTLRVVPPGRGVLADLTLSWIEITDVPRLLRGEPGHFVRVNDVRGDTLQLASSVPAGLFDPDDVVTLIRRWDSDGEITLASGSYLNLEGGVQVEFDDDGTYSAGDFWLIPARATTGRVLWPADNGTARFAPRHGTEHAFAPLALLSDGGTGFAPADCRTEFPPLTDIDASDVSFDDSSCMMGVSTVQEALESLCARDGSCGTITVYPGPNWATPLAGLPAGGDIQICFQAGEYPVTDPVVLSGFGEVKITGYGAGTRLVATGETAMRFENCAGVLVRDVYAEGRGLGTKGDQDGLNGALTFRGCGAVHLEAVTARCASGARRAASCITIDGAPLADGDVNAGIVRVRHCDLRVGHQQLGLLVLNARRSHVADNVIRVTRKPKRLGLVQLLENRHYRAGVRRLMITRGRETDPEELVGIPEGWVVFDVGNISVTFETDPALQSVWEQFREWRTPIGVQSTHDLYAHLRKMADRILTGGGDLRVGDRVFTGFRSWYRALEQSNPAVASQGIVIAGTEARDVRIVDNTVYGALQGIHLGLDDATNETAEMLGTVRLRGNTVQLFLSPFARGRHGIFVGHCDSLLAEDNYIRVRRYPATQDLRVDGMRVDGVLGRRIIVQRNHLVGAGPGIRVRALPVSPKAGLRAIEDNVIEDLLDGAQAVSAQGVTFRISGNETA